MKKFEYVTYNKKLEDRELDILGKKGWELVSHSAIYAGKTIQYYVFKREL